MKHSNCYMVWGGDLVSNQQTRFSQEDMVVGCLVDLATGLMTFTANGKEINTFYQVRKNNEVVRTSLCTFSKLDLRGLWVSYVALSAYLTGDVLFQVEPNTKLFPAVFVQPSSQNMLQLELGKLKVRTYFYPHMTVW